MNLYDFFEGCSLEKASINDQFIYQINNFIPNSNLISIAITWLRGIGSQHQVPGRVVTTMAGICDFYREVGELTRKQQIYVISNLITYWDQISCESRAQMML